ncbi:uncharacterized protein ATC70_000097 [Mucor velutinosus]|uniref:Uncharacterized protein n=1 Tax=Mucor velutinosus TaxID=708070 RepID=A0AAN7DAN0_9FUNG|nr:hypothetical protein ATC70_000097 [Mucor velutinosus]
MDTATAEIVIFAPSSMTKQITPSIIHTSHPLRKGSVSFDLPPEQQHQQPQEEELLSPCITSPIIDINAQPVPDTMLVALVDRGSEMRDLVRFNKPFFSTMANHLDTKWSKFENTLYCERSVMSDSEWLKRISKALQNAPSILDQFKDLVGFISDYDQDSSSSSDEQQQEFSRVDLIPIRSKLDRLSRETYPQFYINFYLIKHGSSRSIRF